MGNTETQLLDLRTAVEAIPNRIVADFVSNSVALDFANPVAKYVADRVVQDVASCDVSEFVHLFKFSNR